MHPVYAACPNKHLTIFARKIKGYKRKFWNKLELHYNNMGLYYSCSTACPNKKKKKKKKNPYILHAKFRVKMKVFKQV